MLSDQEESVWSDFWNKGGRTAWYTKKGSLEYVQKQAITEEPEWEQTTHWQVLQCVPLIRMQLSTLEQKRKLPQNTGCGEWRNTDLDTILRWIHRATQRVVHATSSISWVSTTDNYYAGCWMKIESDTPHETTMWLHHKRSVMSVGGSLNKRCCLNSQS